MRRRCVIWALALPLLVSGCLGAVDDAQLEICRRLVPALHPDGTKFREIRFLQVTSGETAIRIDYAAREPGDDMRVHFARCRFSGGRYDKDRLDLSHVTTDRESLGVARLLYLKRFWLAPAASGGELVAPPPSVPEIPISIAYNAQQLINAAALAGIYGLLATAYSLIYGLVGRINLAFGELAVIGAYGAIGSVAVFVFLGFGDPLIGLAVALPAAAALAALWSWLLGDKVIAPLHAAHRHGQPVLVATVAAAVTIQEFLRLSQGARDRWLPPFLSGPIPVARAGGFVVTVTPMQLCIAATAFSAAIVLLWLLARTRLGREWRAFADDPVAAAMFGVAPLRVLSMTFVLAGLNAGLAGWIIAVYYGNVSFSMGAILGLKALLAAIVGGIGRVGGALLGGILIGLIEAAWSAYFDISTRDIVVFLLLAVMFILRPGGLLGDAGPRPREV